MEKISYNLVFNRKKNLNKRGMALIQVEAYLNKKKMYLSTKIYIKPNQWDDKRKMVKNHPNADILNCMLYEYISTIEQTELGLWQQGKEISLSLLKNLLKKPVSNEKSFLDFYKEELATSSLKESTKHNHLSTLELLQAFKKEIFFTDLTFEFVSSFDSYLQSRGYHLNTIAKHMKHLKRYVNIAINKEYMDIQKYAFRKYRIKSVEGRHTHFYKSVKTGTEVRLPLYLLFEGKGIHILHRYKNDLNSFFKLKDNSNLNKELNVLAKLAGISKHISFHTARHTNATLLIYNGANITTVQKLLGHKSVKTTQVYANIMDITIVRDLEKAASQKNE